MAQNEYETLLVRLEDEINCIYRYQVFLQIALEQFENPGISSCERVELLLSTYLSEVKAHFDLIEHLSKIRLQIKNNKPNRR